MNHVTSFISETLVQALGWTLLHSLWQGAFISLLLSLLLVLLHKQSANVRYAVAGGAMLAQLLLAAGTFLYYYSLPQKAVLSTTTVLQRSVAAAPTTVSAPVPASFWADLFSVAQVYFEQHMPLLVTLWLLGTLVMAIRFVGGIAYTRRLCHYRTTLLGANWQQKTSAISQRMGVRKAVRLVESALVRVPMTVGFAKPVILLPIGAVTGLSQAQVEAILSHELAHILRKDYLVNLLQSVIDILFFYHPAVWWLSGVVRAERENCCDDIAVATCGDTLTYARALAEIEAMRLPAAPAMAVAFSGKRGTLMSRIKRLVGPQSLKPTFTEGFAAALVLVVGLLVLSFGAVAALKPQEKKEAKLFAGKLEHKELKEADEATGAFVYTAQDSAGKARDIVIIKNKKGKVTELYVDGKRIPNKNMDDYKALVDQRLQAVENAPRANRREVALQMKQARAAAAEAGRNQQQNWSFNFSSPDSFQFNFSGGDSLMPPPPAPPVPPAPPAPPALHVAPVPPVPPAPPVPPVPPFNENKEGRKDYEKDLKRYKEEVKAYEKEMKVYDKEMKAYEKEVQAYAEELRANGQLNTQHYKEAAKLQAAHSREMIQHQAELAKHQAEMAQQHQKMVQYHQESLQKVKDELVKDGIIKKGEDDIQIQINNKELYINNKKQPQEIYEKYKKLMNVEGNDSSNFNFQYKSN